MTKKLFIGALVFIGAGAALAAITQGDIAVNNLLKYAPGTQPGDVLSITRPGVAGAATNAATAVQLATKVSKAGDTMTGTLTNTASIIATNTGTKIQGYEIHGLAVVESGVPGTTAGMVSIADSNSWNNLTASNGVLYVGTNELVNTAQLATKLAITNGTAVGLSTDTLQFDTSNTNLAAEGQIAFIDEQGGLVIGMPGGGQLTLGAEGQIRVYNDTGSTLSNGTLVSISGRQGNFPKAILCSATNVAECGIIGMVTTEAGIDDGHFGQVTVWGLVRDVAGLTGYSAGDILYLSETAGGFTSTAPSYPAEPFMVGKVAVVTGNTGDIELRLDGWKTWTVLDSQYAQKLWTENAASSGRLWGGAVSISNTTITIAAGGGLCKEGTVGGDLSAIPTSITNGFGGALTYVTWPETTLTALDGYNIVYWDCSAGAMTNILKSAFFSSFDASQDFTVGRVYYDSIYGGVSRLCGMNVWSSQRRNQIYHDLKAPVELVQGGVVSADGLKLAVTAGRLVAEGYDHFSFDAITTNDNFNVWYQTNSVWTYTATNTLDDATYNKVDEADGEASLTSNRWRVDYAYLLHDGSLHILKGQAQYVSQSLAEDAERATPPDLLAAYGTIISRIAVQEDSGEALIANVDSVAFSQAAAPDLSGYALTDLSNTTTGSGTNVTYTGTADGTNYLATLTWDATNKVFIVTETAQ